MKCGKDRQIKKLIFLGSGCNDSFLIINIDNFVHFIQNDFDLNRQAYESVDRKIRNFLL